MATKNFTFQEVKKAFLQKYPSGSICKGRVNKKTGYTVFFGSGRAYEYGATCPAEIAARLRLFDQEEIETRKGIRRLPCGCPVPVSFDGYKCRNCGYPLRPPTAEELAEDALWSCTRV